MFMLMFIHVILIWFYLGIFMLRFYVYYNGNQNVYTLLESFLVFNQQEKLCERRTYTDSSYGLILYLLFYLYYSIVTMTEIIVTIADSIYSKIQNYITHTNINIHKTLRNYT